jgi:hypothetical protein
MNKLASIMIVSLLCSGFAAVADSIRYEPVNPSFGGNPLNYNHLMGLANSQYSAPTVQRTSLTELEAFADQIRRRTLSSISSAISLNLRDLNFDDPDGVLPDPISIEGMFVEFDREQCENSTTEGTFDGVRMILTDAGERIELCFPSL